MFQCFDIGITRKIRRGTSTTSNYRQSSLTERAGVEICNKSCLRQRKILLSQDMLQRLSKAQASQRVHAMRSLRHEDRKHVPSRVETVRVQGGNAFHHRSALVSPTCFITLGGHKAMCIVFDGHTDTLSAHGWTHCATETYNRGKFKADYARC